MPPEISSAILRNNGGGNYTVIYEPDDTLINSVGWQPGAHQAFYGDFDGNQQQDIFLQPIDINSEAILILAPSENSDPETHQVIVSEELGENLAVNNGVTLILADINGDGRTDLKVFKSWQNDRASLADESGYLQPLMSGIVPCYINNDLDTDCDGTIDSLDDFPFDPSQTIDTDRDGIPDSLDLDDDGDGVPDAADTDLSPAGSSVSYSLDKFNGAHIGLTK